jgi:hypothetical protein
MGLAFALAGIAACLYSDRITLDLMARTFTRRSGYWPKLTTQRGSFDELQGVALQIDYQNSSNQQPIPCWALYLVLRAPAASISLASFGNEQAAYTRLASLAKKLGVAAIDRTGDQEKTTLPDRLDQPIAMQRRTEVSASAIPPLPTVSRIHLTGLAPARKIVLPPYGFSLGITLIFGWFAMIPFWMSYMGWHDKVTGRHPNTSLGLIAITAFLGCFFLLLIPAISTNRILIVESATTLSIGLQLFGLPVNLRPIDKSAIDEIAVKPAPYMGTSYPKRPDLSRGFPQPIPSRHEVCVRSPARLIRIGSNLSPAEQEWLKQALLAMVSGV